jgi:glycosyltransferase involved in cell wall biosynthesis
MLARAVESVLSQTHDSVEVLVVNDGSNGECEREYEQLAEKYSGRVAFINLAKTKSGHGQCFAINVGAEHALGKYLCFLDDDDFWIDDDHLKRVSEIIETSNESVDVHFSNQQACRNGEILQEPGWLSRVQDYARDRLRADTCGAYRVTPKDLLSCGGFGHPNTTVVKRSLFEAVGGFDRYLRCQTDRDFYVRIIDKAQKIVYSPVITAQHSVPDPSNAANVSTKVSDEVKLLTRLYCQNKAILFSERKEIRAAARRHNAYTLKRLAEIMRAKGDYGTASHYAGQALVTGFTWKWLLYYIDTKVRSLFFRTE